MDELNKSDEPIEDIIEEEEDELGISDKIVSVLTEPSELFSNLANYPPKAVDWFIPVFLVIVLAIASVFITMSNPEIKANAVEKQMEMVEKNFQEMVDKGQMSQAQADEQLDRIQDQMDNAGSGQLMMQSVGMFIIIFISFFVITGVFHLLAKAILGGEATYKHSMVAYGLPYYILAIQVIVMIVLAIAMGKVFMDTSVGSFLDVDKSTLVGTLLHKLDIFSIWFYAAVSIGFAKMFKSDSVAKSFMLIFGTWIIFSIIMYFVANALPFLKWFGF